MSGRFFLLFTMVSRRRAIVNAYTDFHAKRNDILNERTVF